MQLEEKLKKSQQKRERKAAGEEKEAKKSRVDRVFVAGRGATVLTETEELDSINYRPKTKQSRLGRLSKYLSLFFFLIEPF